MGRGRKEPAARRDAADPGKYHPNVSVVQPRAASWGFGSSRRMLSEPSKLQRSIPGVCVGQTDNPNYFRSPRYGFGSTERDQNPVEGSWVNPEDMKFRRPGPGQHNPKSDYTSAMDASPSVTMGPRRELAVNMKLPGPGSYTIDDGKAQTWKSSPRFKFGSSQRGVSEKQGPPGPGQYKVANMTKTGHSSMGDSAPKWSMTGRPKVNLTTREWC